MHKVRTDESARVFGDADADLYARHRVVEEAAYQGAILGREKDIRYVCHGAARTRRWVDQPRRT